MTHKIRVLVESAVFWSDLAQQWRKRGNMAAVAKCELYERERWAQVDWLLNHTQKQEA